MLWSQKTIESALGELISSGDGISAEEARVRLKKYGPNEFREKKKKTPLLMFLDQFRDFMILVLIVAAVISGFIGDLNDTVAILFIVVLNALIGFIQEYRAEKAMEALKKISAPTACVKRNGKPETIPASGLVPGDIVLLEAGNIVPADLRLTEAASLQIDESALTGESVPTEKISETLHEGDLAIGDRRNLAYNGCSVTRGRGAGIVYATGMETELGRIAAMLQTEKDIKTPLQKRLGAFGRKLVVAALLICAIIFIAGVLRGEELLLMLLTSISLAVAAIPEALPAVITISLALGAKKLVVQHALIRRLPAVETLGSITYICTDKTGTLTMNRMTVEKIFINGTELNIADSVLIHNPVPTVGNRDTHSLFFTAMAISNDSKISSDGSFTGDPTEIALCEAAQKYGFDKSALGLTLPRVAEIPFDSGRKLMTTVHSLPEGGFISFTKGAADIMADKTSGVLTSGGPVDSDKQNINEMNDRMASDGLRVLCIAMKKWDTLPEEISPERMENGLTVLGIAGMLDPPRDEAREAVSLCKKAGIQPVMITGDHPETAKAIAGRLGIIDDNQNAVITGKELEKLSTEELKQKAGHVRVYARVAPEQKLTIVKALQDNGQYVAMTGDGVNDAPALKRADIGVAMGITGTDVAKEASDMVLLDDNFSTIVRAVREGRKIYDNIRKFIKYLLTTNSGEVWVLFLAPFMGLPLPLLPIQLLWINLVTDGLPALALSAEPSERNVMDRPPRPPDESIFAHGLGIHALWVGLLMAGIVLFVQAWSIYIGDAHWQTMVFTALCLTQLGHALAIRSERESLFTIGIFSNMYMIGAVALTFVLQMATIYVPALNQVFKTEPLTFGELMITIALSSLVFIAVEIEKFIKRRRASL
jgi:P-type Ca2+ transporter type 2C